MFISRAITLDVLVVKLFAIVTIWELKSFNLLVKEEVIVSLLAGAILSKNIVILELWVCNIPTSLIIFEIGSEGGFPPSNKSFPPMLNRTISGDEIVEVAAKKNLNIIDLTGAGDLFAAGFLHGYINGLNTKDSLEKGTELSSKIIQIMGARI